MGVFDEHGGEASPMMGQLEKCKRDYEAEIERFQTKQKATSSLIMAVEGYIDLNGHGNRTFTLTELYGRLSLEMKSQGKTIVELQELWEQEK